MLRKILAAFGFGWRRLDDASTFSWALPATWGTTVSVVGTIATALVSAAYNVPPYVWIPLAVLVASFILATVNFVYVIREHRHGRSMTPPAAALQIHFDPLNPAKRYWSFESPRDKDGNQLSGIFHEYRVAILNPTASTIRNVGVTVESLGLSGLRPYDAWFEKDRSARRDINPGCVELVPVLRWPHPKRQLGMLAEPSSLIGYGPLLVTASADDVAPAARQFWFSPEREPMLFDLLDPEEEKRARTSLTLLLGGWSWTESHDPASNLRGHSPREVLPQV